MYTGHAEDLDPWTEPPLTGGQENFAFCCIRVYQRLSAETILCQRVKVTAACVQSGAERECCYKLKHSTVFNENSPEATAVSRNTFSFSVVVVPTCVADWAALCVGVLTSASIQFMNGHILWSFMTCSTKLLTFSEG